MFVIDRALVLPVDCLLVGAEAAGVSLPTLLTPEPLWRDPTETRAHREEVRDLLANHGVWRSGQPTEAFLNTMTVLGRATREFSALVDAAPGHYRLHVAAQGHEAVLARFEPDTGLMALCPIRADALAEALLAELPQARPAAGPSLSVPESDLRRAVDGAAPRGDVRRVLEIAGLPRLGAGQISAGGRDGVRGHRTTGDSCCTYYDTSHGRYLFSFTEHPGQERYIIVSPGRPDIMTTKIHDLAKRLNSTH
ncbi:ESX secretion-associated protein EspG [Actinokineospora enzanensis]|uniref:ESX secretion-associated protein EspG n=1 Tax=Actinokineospora enzanensis TaxID=155975 RepID=UPI00037C8936|nr:ESX secretion-associated protein EspG [Actinokineospora enzanensis]